jgi:hypothetical protein
MADLHRVVLNGGLGNQLFQLAALLSSPVTATLEVELSLGQFQSSLQIPEFMDEMRMPFKVNIHRERKLTKCKRKISNAILVLSEKDEPFVFVTLRALRILFSIILFLSSGQIIRIITCREMAHFSEGRIGGNCLLIGYFQTAEWASMERVKNQLVQIKLKNSVRAEVVGNILSNLPNPLGIHYRLGDYSNEREFGLLSNAYYSAAIKKIDNPIGSIVIFSNEPKVATQRFREISTLNFSLAPTDLSTVETFQLMRSCKKIIMANSSLSWWGAFLGESDSVGGNVVCPSPWFEFLKTNERLLPTGWVKVNPWQNRML